jgi:hypothetical protein
MSLSLILSQDLTRLVGLNSTQPVSVSLPSTNGVDMVVDFTVVDSMSCAFRELRMDVPRLAGTSFSVLKQWADDLSQRITYLLENLGPLEFDPVSKEVLIRSKSPDQRTGGARYYEILLQCQSSGRFFLRRYYSDPAQAGRDQVDVQMTHETLLKLVDDLVATVP